MFNIALKKILFSCHLISESIFSPFLELAAYRFAPSVRVPPHFLIQLLAIEDKRFLIHPGIDLISMTRAILSDIKQSHCFQGASTITQQLYDIRREILGLRRERTICRKMCQALWALWIEMQKSKYEILSEYLNTVYWGKSYYGLDAASWGYFKNKRDNLTIAQSFFLAERLAIHSDLNNAA